jgi:hypothetical protein
MSNRYRVSIPVEAAIQDGIDVSITHKLKDGMTLGDMLRVRVEDTITYLEIEVEAEERNEAITSALVMAWRLVQLISLVYNKGFEVGLAGIRAILIAPLEPPVEIREEEGSVHVTFRETLHISDHLRLTEHISTLDPLLPIWKRMNQSANVTADGLEWLYLGKIASNERMTFRNYSAPSFEYCYPWNKGRNTVECHVLPTILAGKYDASLQSLEATMLPNNKAA